jgi:hypothetical protein
MSSLTSRETLLETPLRITSIGQAIQLGKEEFIRYYVQEQSGLIGQPAPSDLSACRSVSIAVRSVYEEHEMDRTKRSKKRRGEDMELEPQRFTTRPINFNAMTRYAKRLSVGKIDVAKGH